MFASFQKYRVWFTALIIVILTGFGLGMLVFGEAFLFWEYPFSDLGATVTENGFPNRPSMIIFITTMIMGSIIFFVLAFFFAFDKSIVGRGIRAVFCITGAVGMLIATFPHDLYNLQHSLGSGFFVGSLWALCLIFLIDLARYRSKIDAARLHLVLHTTVVSYAFLFLIDSPSKQVFQKFALVGLCVVPFITLNKLAKLNENESYPQKIKTPV